MPSDTRYDDLQRYIESGASRISREAYHDGMVDHRGRRQDLYDRILAFITDIRMLDREISIEAQEGWKKLPVIEAE